MNDAVVPNRYGVVGSVVLAYGHGSFRNHRRAAAAASRSRHWLSIIPGARNGESMDRSLSILLVQRLSLQPFLGILLILLQTA
jgi:hypothetical protein